MSDAQDERIETPIRFKRRKKLHPKRGYSEREEEAPQPSSSHRASESAQQGAPSSNREGTEYDEETAVSLREIMRNRRRPHDRFKEIARKAESCKMELVALEVQKPEQHTTRFVGQTGQVVDQDNEQMTEYVEARTAEKNFRNYGWPVPMHLQASVAAIAPDLKDNFQPVSSRSMIHAGTGAFMNTRRGNQLNTGHGRLQEVDLGADASTRHEPKSQRGRDKYGYAWRNPKRRNSDAARRDQMVEAVLREAKPKVDYFDDSAPADTHQNSNGNNDDAVAERFRRDYIESVQEARRQRRAAANAANPKGVKEPSRGPKLGGSKSARARILKAQEGEKRARKK